MHSATVTIRMFSTFQVAVDGDLVPIAGNKQRVVLSLLAMWPSRPVMLEKLSAAVWGDHPPDDPRRTVQGYIGRLRSCIGRSLIQTLPGGYRLDVTPENIDLHRFRMAVTSAEEEEDTRNRRARLCEALSLVADAPLANLRSEAFDRYYRPALREEVLQAVEHRIDIDLELGCDYGALVVELSRLVDEHPTRESAWARLIAALDRSGRHGDALAAYEMIRRRLRNELGADPGETLQRLHHMLLEGNPAAWKAVRAGSEARRAAAPRSDTPSSFAPPDRRPRPKPKQLPPDLAQPTGRRYELDLLHAMFSAHRASSAAMPLLVTVVGPPGIGKTALVVHWSHQTRDQFPDGQIYLHLRGASDEPPVTVAEALSSLLRTLGVPSGDIPSGTEERAAMYRSVTAKQQLLIILDDAVSPAQIRPLLPASPCLVLVTSRNQLRGSVSHDGARQIPLGPLDAEASKQLLVRPDDTRTENDPAHVAEIVRMCSGFPLALRLAGEHLDRHPERASADLVRDLLDENAGLGGLASGGDPASDLRSVFSRSYRALDPSGVNAFRCLSLHPATDMSLSAAAALIGRPPSEARAVIDQLVCLNLLEARPGDRYGFHELLRLYALQDFRSNPTGRDAALVRMLDFYLETSLAARRKIRPGSSPDIASVPAVGLHFDTRADAIGWYDTERASLVAVMVEARRLGLARYACQMMWAMTPPAVVLGKRRELITADQSAVWD